MTLDTNTQPKAPMDDAEAQFRQQEQLSHFAQGLGRLAEEQVGLRTQIEDRWIKDIRQYNGQYDPEIAAKFRDKDSKIFVNITRNKTNAGEARLIEMLFPADDKNWGIGPTPVPDLVEQAKNNKPVQLPDGSQAQVDGKPVTHGDLARHEMEIAKTCAKAMEQEIDDQLTEARYSQKCRDVVHHACVMGTGVIKGPVVIGKVRRSWQKMDTPQGSIYVMTAEEVKRPTVDVVNPWNFFPDMSARNVDEAEFFFELHPMTKAEARRLAKNPGFRTEAIRALLREEPKESIVYSRAYELKEISGITGVSWDNRYHVWEYHGPVSKADLEAAGANLPDEITDDPLMEFDGVIWFCQGHVLKAAINPMDSEDRPYSVFCWEKDDNCIFGYGVPYLSRNPQKVMNASWRMILDNAGLSVGPQIVVDRDSIQPADGDWTLRPRKVWYVTRPNTDVRQAFMTFDIPTRQQELSAIFEAARQLADEETSLPVISQGEQAGNTAQTMGGMSMLLNNANIVLKRAVKNWDDDVTTQFIQRMYDWNMQFSDKENIKGDHEVYARGTSVLLIKETQSRNIMNLMNLAISPVFAPYAKLPDLFRKAVQLMQIPADEVVKSEDQISAEEEQAKQQPPQNPDVAKAQMQMQMKQMEMQAKAEELKVQMIGIDTNKELTLAKMAFDRQINVDTLRTQLGLKEADLTSKKDLMEFEGMIKARFGSGL